MAITAIAHRGYSAKYPENTLSAFEAAIELGFSHIEIDVHLSKDSVPVVMHDKTINRTTDGKGLINAYTLAELKTLRVKQKERIPTLLETLELARGRASLAIELKQEGALYPGLEKNVLHVIEETGMANDVYIQSFDHESIGRVRELSNDVQLGLIKKNAGSRLLPYMRKVGATFLAMNYPYLTRRFARKCEQEGIQLIVWPIDGKKRMLTMKKHYPQVWCTVKDLDEFKKWYI
ncbi:glycerophosphodiester phosphodiesterase [Shouchella shacheensis]|uniref:glycerophosphodiester phosphodiesterase n=1 Tax=Shouchella shacheensis TaxID=1649580 RepID=UPI00074041BC|nr:glycerophosphodiester phosphodiesterase family protein [Shouchella shacheensis]